MNTRNKRVGCDGGSESDSDVDIDIDTDREEEKDSRYSSNTDNEVEYLSELVEQFREMGPQISNLGDVSAPVKADFPVRSSSRRVLIIRFSQYII
jgi:hypothetical protein